MADQIKVTVDLTEFNTAIKEYIFHSKMEISEAVNKKAGDIALFAAKRAKKATRGSYPPLSSGLYNALVAADPKKSSGPFAKAAEEAQHRIRKKFSGPIPRGKRNAKAAAYLFSRRSQSAGYSKALFVKLANDLGKAVTGVRVSKKKQASIDNATGKKAKVSGTFDKPFAVLEIKGVEQDHANNEIEPALQAGVNDAVKDMGKYINRKLRELARKHSGRRR